MSITGFRRSAGAIGVMLLTVTNDAPAFGEAEGYKCNIKHSLELGKGGVLQPHVLADTYRNKEFVVDRASGRMLGGTTSEIWNRKVLDRGSDQQSYKAIYTSQQLPYLHVQLLQIGEYEQGPVTAGQPLQCPISCLNMI